MRQRLFSFFLTLVVVLGILPMAALAAPTEEAALGEVDIYNGGVEMSYLTINGSVRTQKYTYFKFTANDGTVREVPAYCVNPNIKGVPQTVGVGESIKYLAEEKSSDPKVVGIISNGYPHRGLGELRLDDRYQAYYATKMALWCYLLPNWSINNLKVAPGLTGADLDAAQRVLAAAKDIYKRGTTYNYMLEPRMTCTPDRSVAYPVNIGGEEYKQQVFTVWSETWVYDYDVAVAFADPASVPAGTKIVNMEDQEIDAVTTEWTGDGYGGQFKVLYPADSVAGLSGSDQISLSASVAQYAAMYAVCQEKDKYGNLQNYICDLDNNRQMDLAAVSSYVDKPDDLPKETSLRIVKLEEGTQYPLEGAVFSVHDPEGRKVGSFSSGPDGTVTIPLTLEGHYTVTEEIPPAFHLLPNVRTQHVDVEYDKMATVTFWNAPFGNLRVSKISDTGDPLNGVTIQIKHIATGETRTAQTRIGGTVVFEDLTPGGWEVRELAGIPGWEAETDIVQTISVISGETVDTTIINRELPGLRLIKYDRKNMVVMPDVTFAVYRDGEFLGNYQTDEFGEVLIAPAQPGTYRAVEVDTGSPAHILCTTPQEIELKAGDGIRDLLFFNDVRPGLRLVKVDSADPSKTIPNAVFEIKSVDGSFGPQEFRTDQNGEINLSMLPVGAYVITEKMCEGYVIDDAQRIIHLDANETDAQFVFTNSKLPSLTLYKESADGTPLAGVSYRLARIEDGGHYLDRTTGPDGTIVWESLEPGVFSLVETSTLETHILDPREHHIQLFAGKDSTICLQNDRRSNLTIWKHDADSGRPIPDTVFIVRGADGHSIAEVTTGADGSATVPNLLPMVVEVIEKSVPSPYLKDAPSQLVTLFPNRDRDVFFENHKKPTVTIRKENSITHDPIPHTSFSVLWASNKTTTGELRDLGTFQTNESGEIVLEGIEDGWLKITELEPAPGFSLPEQATQEIYISGGESKTVLFEDDPLSALVVFKRDSVSGAGIADCLFQIRYLGGGVSGSGGTVIGTYKTSTNGSFTVTGLREGYYICEELASDSDHVIDSAPQTAYISGKEQDVVTLHFTNSPKGSVLVKKISAADNTPLSDVEFLVTTSTGAVVGDANGKFVTDSTGSFLIEGIEPETTLVIKETLAKPGFLLDSTPVTVKVSAGQCVTIEVRNQPLGNLIIHKLSSADKKTPLEGVCFKITYADGSYLPDEQGRLSSNGLYWTDSSGQIVLSNLHGTVVVTEQTSIPGYSIDENTRTQTVVIHPNDTQQLYFYNKPTTQLVVEKYITGTDKEPLAGVEFLLTDSSGAVIGPNNGIYTTDSTGRFTVSGLSAGTTVTAREVKTVPGFVLDGKPQSILLKDGTGPQTLTFWNAREGGLELTKVNEADKTERIPNTTFEIRRMDGGLVDTMTTDERGRFFLPLEAGDFYAVEVESAENFKLDATPHYFTVKDNAVTPLTVTNKPLSGILIHKTSSATGEGIYGVSFLLYDAAMRPIGQYSSDQDGWVYIDDLSSSGKFHLRELENEGYIPDNQIKTVYVTAGAVTTVEWENTPITGQIQIIKKSADYNPTNGLPAGTLLEGAVFEITDRAGNVVDTIRSDSRGLAVSKPLPLSRYTIREIKAPANYGINDTELTAYLEHEGQILRFEVTNQSLATGVSITKTGPKEIMAGQPVRYTFSNIANNSNVRLDSFYWRDTLPAEVRLESVTTGTYNRPGTYKIVYRVNGGEYQTLADNLSTSKNYTLAASATALGLAANERVTEVMFVFGQAPAGFAQVEKPHLQCKAVSALASASFVNTCDVGGVYNGQWVQAVSRWVIQVYGKPVVPTLPRTGY